MSNINLPEELVYYFGLYLIQREESGDATSESLCNKLFRGTIQCWIQYWVGQGFR